MFITFTCSAIAATVKDMRLASFSNGTGRIVLETDSRADSKIFLLENPRRLVVDLSKSSLSGQIQKKEFKPNNVISKVRFGKPEKNVARVVFDLSSAATESHFILPPENKNGVWRLVIDLKPSKNVELPVKSTAASSLTVVKKEPV